MISTKRKSIVCAFAACTFFIHSSFMSVSFAYPQGDKKETQRISYQNRKEIPTIFTWNLANTYPNLTSWEKDKQEVKRLADDFAKHQGKWGQSAKALAQGMEAYSQLMRLLDKVNVYATLNFDIQTADPSAQAILNQAEKIRVYVKEKTAWVGPELILIPDQKMEKFLQAKELAPYKPFIEEKLRTKQHMLPKEQEQLLASFTSLGENPENTYKMLSKDIPLPLIKVESGKMVPLTRTNYATYLESKDQRVRKAAYQAMYQTLEKYQDTLAQTIAGQIKANNLYASNRKYKNALEASLTPNHVPVEVYDQLISTVNKNLPLLERYLKLRKEILSLPELHMYDLYVPLFDRKTEYIPYEQAREMVVKGIMPLGEEYVSHIKMAFDNRWIDVYSTPDKRTGAYQWGAYDTHPYVLLNYQGLKGDVSTIAHELGHAMQSYYTNKAQPYITSGYPIFTAEVASTMNENLLFTSQYKSAQTNKEKMAFLVQNLENFRTTLFRQTQFAEFEKAMHEAEQRGEALQADSLKKMYLDINKKYYGKQVVMDQEIAMEWARVPHFYYNYYVYQYATSFAASVALAKQVEAGGKPEAERYIQTLLSLGSSKPPLIVLKEAGVDMTTAKPIEDAMQVFKERLDELERLMKETNGAF
ncbi:oligoendopeptidase F [Brevibacillus laterosporus]|nr:oligoendopeptidase F [Brevibacillus laterosporus]TPG83628.1 oligoendopeptidase F [Brevibacillus laterosporus]